MLNTMIRRKTWLHWIIRSLQIQLFVSVISLPFLIAWGLPISILSPVSTIIFGPFLTIFLLFSSLIFFSELLYLPNAWLIWCLNHITNGWLSILQFEQQSWLIGFIRPTLVVLFCIPIAAAFIIHYKKTNNITRSMICLALLSITVGTGLKLFAYLHHEPIEHITCGKKQIILINNNNKTILIDPGAIATQSSVSSWISYNLMPDIIKKTGRLVIDHLIILQLSSRIFEALAILATKIHIKKMYIPIWQGTLPKRTLWLYMKLKKTLEESGGTMVRIHTYPINFTISKTTQFTLEPLKEQLTYLESTYPCVCVRSTIDNTSLTFYAEKHKTHQGEK